MIGLPNERQHQLHRSLQAIGRPRLTGRIGEQMTEMTDQSSRGPSAWARDLHAHLTSHVQAERSLLEEYSAMVEKTESKAFRYLVNLLIEDEIRHHRIFAELAESLKTEALLTGEEPTVPYLDFGRSDTAAGPGGYKDPDGERRAGREGTQAPSSGTPRREGHLIMEPFGRSDATRHR